MQRPGYDRANPTPEQFRRAMRMPQAFQWRRRWAERGICESERDAKKKAGRRRQRQAAYAESYGIAVSPPTGAHIALGDKPINDKNAVKKFVRGAEGSSRGAGTISSYADREYTESG